MTAEHASDDHSPRTLGAFARHYLRDLIYGANDGIVTTFAVIAGVAGAQLQTGVVLVLGSANLVADGFSMAASSFLANRSENAARHAEGRETWEPFPARHAAATFAAFGLAGALPLAAYVAFHAHPFLASCIVAALTQFGVGAVRALVTPRSWWRAGLEMLIVGGIAALLAYAAGAIISHVNSPQMSQISAVHRV